MVDKVKGDELVDAQKKIEKEQVEQKNQTAVAVVPTSQNIVMPQVTPEQAKASWQAYSDLKKSIIEPADIQEIEGKVFLKKSYWRKTATFFNLSVEAISERSEQMGKTFAYHFTYKATAPNGRSSTGEGSCDVYEKAEMVDGKYVKKGAVTKWGKTKTGKSFPEEFELVPATPNSIHNVRSTAATRAFNRAVSNLVGGGEVSADEIVR